jgi:hypothetical protein
VTNRPDRPSYGYVHLDDPSGHALEMHRILSRVAKRTVEKASITRRTRRWILDSDECDQVCVSIDRNPPGGVMIHASEETPTWPFMLRVDRVALDIIPRADADGEAIRTFTAKVIRHCTAALLTATTRIPEDPDHALAQETVAIRMALATLEAAARREEKGRMPTATEWRIVAPSPFHQATITHDRTQYLDAEMPNAVGIRIHVPGPSPGSEGRSGTPYMQIVESWRRITPSQYSITDVMALHTRLAAIEDILRGKP